MIIQNKSDAIGDIITIKTDTPLLGLITLQSFIDVTQGEYIDRFFSKSFRYSVDGVNYTQFVPLTNNNLANVQVQANDTFYAEYRYQREGVDPTGLLEFDSVTLTGLFSQLVDGPAYNASNFAQYFNQNNICSIAWSVNVLEKLYKKGIVPKYIERGLTGDNADDRDYIDFWRAITHYFALFVCLARKFQFFYQDRNLLLEYLKQRGLFVCEDIDQQDLLYLMQNYYDEIRQRGTRQVFKSKSNTKEVDGEYLRLICFDTNDEFISNLNKNEHIGWNVGNSSPLYKGVEGRLNTNKFYIDFVDDISSFSDLSVNSSYLPYLSIGESSISNSISSSNSNSDSTPTTYNNDVLIIHNPGNNNMAGIGNGDKKIIINPHIDYEITFFIKTRNSILPQITFGVNAYDINNNLIDLLQIDTLAIQNNFLVQQQMNQEDKFYFVRGILFNKNNYKPYDSAKSYKANSIVSYSGSYYKSKRAVPVNGTILDLGVAMSEPGIIQSNSPILWDFWQILTTDEISGHFKTNLNLGHNLLLVDSVVKIDPYILYDNTNNSTADIYIKDIRVQPLSTDYSKGFIQVSNILEIWNTQNNQTYSEKEIEDIAKRYLIPYNVILKENFIPSEIN